MSKYAIQVKDVRKRFSYSSHKNDSLKRAITQIFKSKDNSVNTFYALDGVSFNVEKGDFFGILGRNGSGKSTLLKIISEIYQPTSGSVKHDGKLVSFIELGVGFKAELTGKENVYLNAALLGFSRSEIDEMYDDIVAFSELEKFMDQQLKNYSSGMKVRLAFSVAIRSKADILVLDEVLAVGDAAFQRKCNEYFQTLKDDSKTVILVTHSMGAVRQYCNKAILIEEGKILHSGDAEEVADRYLDLFNTNKSNSEKASNSERIGDGSIVVEDILVELLNNELRIRAVLKASQTERNNVKFGFQIRDNRGVLIAGASNKNVEGARDLKLRPGSSTTLTFIMPNIFGNQTYTVSTTVNADNGLTLCDKWNNAASFTSATKNAFYPIVCPAKLEVSE